MSWLSAFEALPAAHIHSGIGVLGTVPRPMAAFVADVACLLAATPLERLLGEFDAKLVSIQHITVQLVDSLFRLVRFRKLDKAETAVLELNRLKRAVPF